MSPIKVLKRIDTHHHVIPPQFIKTMKKYNLDTVAGAPLPSWSPEKSLDVMDTCSIETAILSLSCPGVYFGDELEAVSLARACNEYTAELKQQNPGRVGFFAVLPMPFTECACEEAIYALDHLGADGIVLMGSSNGIFLGDSRFEELMAELNRRKTVVFVHPNVHETSETLGLDLPAFLMEFTCDTTRGAVNLIFKGVLERYPNIKWILSHAGGFLPYIAWRLSLSTFLPGLYDKAPQGVLNYIKRFYYDTALSTSPFAINCVKELVGPEQILFGSDFPFAPKPLTLVQTQTIDNELFSEAELRRVNRGNALSLFPQYASETESATNVTEYNTISGKALLKYKIRSGVSKIIDKVRN